MIFMRITFKKVYLYRYFIKTYIFKNSNEKLIMKNKTLQWIKKGPGILYILYLYNYGSEKISMFYEITRFYDCHTQ